MKEKPLPKPIKKKVEKLFDQIFPTPKKFQKAKTFQAKDPLGKLLQKLSKAGTVTLRVRACGKGFQLKGYFGTIPQGFDLRGDDPILLTKEALKLQKKG